MKISNFISTVSLNHKKQMSNKINIQPNQYTHNLNYTNYFYPLSFQGGYSLDLAKTTKELKPEQYPPDIREIALDEVKNDTDKTLYDIHFSKYAKILDCYSLDELKKEYPEFKDVLSANSIEARNNSFLSGVQEGKSNIFTLSEDFTLQLIKLYWGKGFSLNDISKYIADDTKISQASIHYIMTKKLNIPLMNSRYAIVLKLSNREYNKQFSEEMSIKRKEAHEAKIQKAQGEPVIIPRGNLSEAHKAKISESLKKYYIENPDKALILTSRQKEYYMEHPEERQKRSQVMNYAWNKTQEGRSIHKHILKFIKKYNITISNRELEGKDELDEKKEKVLIEFFKKNIWAKEKLSIAVKKGWASLDKIENDEIENIKQNSICFDIYPKQVQKAFWEWVEKNNINAPDVEVGRAYIYPDSGKNKDFEKKEKEANKIAERFENEHSKLSDIIADARIFTMIDLKNDLENNSSNLPQSLKENHKDRLYLNSFMDAKFEKYPIYYTVNGQKHPRANIKSSMLLDLQVNIIMVALANKDYDIVEYYDRMLEKNYYRAQNIYNSSKILRNYQ